MLKVSELRARKHILEQAIAKLAADFEQETGVGIDGLITLTHQHHCDEHGVIGNSIEVEIHLEM